MKLSRLKDKFKIIENNEQTYVGWTYHIVAPVTVTLPDTAGIDVGDKVTFTKKLNIVPTIQRFGSTVIIQTQFQSDSAVFFDVEAEIIFVWNGTTWEV